MTTPTGFIQASDVNVELGRAWNAPFNLNDAAVRSLAGKPSGAISFADLRGKSNIIREPPSGDYWGRINGKWYGMSYISFYGLTEVDWADESIAQHNGKPNASYVKGNWTYYRGTHQGGDSYSIYRMGRY